MDHTHQNQNELDHVFKVDRKTQRPILSSKVLQSIPTSSMLRLVGPLSFGKNGFDCQSSLAVNWLGAPHEDAWPPEDSQVNKNYTPDAIGNCEPKSLPTQYWRGLARTTHPLAADHCKTTFHASC